MPDTIPYYDVIGCGQSWIIADGSGQPVNGRSYRCQHIATARAHHLENEARLNLLRRPRDCLHCGARFISDGPHNRLCGPCRSRD